MATVRADVEVDIDEFEDSEVLDAALAIVRNHKSQVKPDYPPRLKLWEATEAQVERLASVLGIAAHPDMPPASTAASVTSLDQLRAICGREVKCGEPVRIENGVIL